MYSNKQVMQKREMKPSSLLVKPELPTTHTLEPYVTGTSIVAVRYKDGVCVGGDTLASYGSMARFRDIERIRKVNDFSLVGATGEYSDFQYINQILEDLVVDDEIQEDGSRLSPKAIHSYLTRVMYQRRNKGDPLWNQLVIAGFKDGKSYLGLTDSRGTCYEDDTIATGYASFLSRPLMRSAKPAAEMTEAEAKELIETCLKVLFYRDARALDRVQIATVTARGVEISAPYDLKTDWDCGKILYSGFNIKNTNYLGNVNQ